MSRTQETVLSLSNITKVYPGVIALDDVSIAFKRGEIHAIVGENGAGKSTLIKTIAGAVRPDKGTIACEGNIYQEMTPTRSRNLGIEVVYQEFNLIGTLSAGENICLGEKYGRFVNRRKINSVASKIFEQFRIDIDPNMTVQDLPTAQQQIVEISKAISKNAKILVLDEPTAPLTVTETERLFEIINALKKKDVTVIYISHRLDEIFAICDKVSVLRDGKYVTTLEVSETNRQELIKLMVGRELSASYPQREHKLGECALRVDNITTDVVKNISFEVKRGEILGLSGLVGSGRTEVVRAIFGADKRKAGDIYIYGKKFTIKSPKDAIAQGIGLIPEDRKRQGAFLNFSVLWNSSIVCIKKICKGPFVNARLEASLATDYCDKLNIRTPGILQTVRNLSGGNQQKVVLAKTLAANSNIIIFDEPTRGIDVGARYEIYILMNKLVEEGRSIIMITSDMEELLGMSDRIFVMCEGRFSGELIKGEFNQVRVLELASGEAERSLKL